jgi:hypothetical protein
MSRVQDMGIKSTLDLTDLTSSGVIQDEVPDLEPKKK